MRKSRKNPNANESQVEKNFTNSSPPENSSSVTISLSNLNKSNASSQPVGKVFVEEERGFRAVDRHGVNLHCSTTLNLKPTDNCAAHIAFKTENCFHTFSTFCHGLLAGMSLWQCIAAYQLSLSHFSAADFIVHYSFLLQPIQTLFYFLCVTCTVSAFDRFDVGNPRWSEAKQILLCKTSAVAVLLYPLSLLLSLSISNIDDKFCLYRYNSSEWNSFNFQDVDDELIYWKAINTARCFVAVLGWIIIALQPNVNSFLKYLEFVSSRSRNTISNFSTVDPT